MAEFGGFDFDAPWKSLKAKDKKLVLYGTGSRSVHVTYKNRFNRKRSYEALFEGIIPWLQRRHGESESDWSREQIEQYMREVDCPACGGDPSRCQEGTGVPEFMRLDSCRAFTEDGEIATAPGPRQPWEPRQQ